MLWDNIRPCVLKLTLGNELLLQKIIYQFFFMQYAAHNRTVCYLSFWSRGWSNGAKGSFP